MLTVTAIALAGYVLIPVKMSEWIANRYLAIAVSTIAALASFLICNTLSLRLGVSSQSFMWLASGLLIATPYSIAWGRKNRSKKS
mgnify:CR=1 FL=1